VRQYQPPPSLLLSSPLKLPLLLPLLVVVVVVVVVLLLLLLFHPVDHYKMIMYSKDLITSEIYIKLCQQFLALIALAHV
jgi:hypothetical protein